MLIHCGNQPRHNLILVLVLTLLLAACSQSHKPVHTHTNDFGFAEIVSFDTVVAEGAIHIVVAGQRAGSDTTSIHYSYSTNGGRSWAAPVRIDHGLPEPYGMHLGNGVQLAVSGATRVAAWPTKGTGYMGSGPLVTAVSTDAGAHWHPGPSPADGGGTAGHGFADMVADAQGNIHIIWLDSRNGHQALYHAVFTDGGHWRTDRNIDAATCQCCWNTLAARPDGGVVALYRDAQPRDMALAVSGPGTDGWDQRGRVGTFNWYIQACPHAGGGLAITPKGIHAVVYTGKPGMAGLYHLFSADGGRHWRGPTQLAGPKGTAAALAAHDHGRLATVWISHGRAGSAIMLAQSLNGGRSWSQRRLAGTSVRHGTRPRIVATAAGWTALWITAADHGASLAMARFTPDQSHRDGAH